MFILTEENTIRTVTEITNCKIMRYNDTSLTIQSSFGHDGVKRPSLCYITDDIESVSNWLNKEKSIDDIKNIYKIMT